jgi:hypothetical protein
MVSVDSAGVQGNLGSYGPSISSDGRYVAFESWASNLVPNDTNDEWDVFVHEQCATLSISIDIEPWFKPNIIDWKFKWAPIPVAILSKPGVDAPKIIDQASLTFGHNGDENSLAFCIPLAIDVNADKSRDLICFFYTGKMGFQCGDTEGILKGKTKDGTPIEGSDSVKIVPCK